MATFDPAELLASVDGDREFLVETIELLEQDAPLLLEAARAAFGAGDAPAVLTAAHTLKGMVANFRAEPARQAAAALETLGRHGKLDDFPEVFSRLTAETERLLADLRQFAKG